MNEKWSNKYKQSIDCDNPKGFSQRAHCQGKKKSFKEMREYVRGLSWVANFFRHAGSSIALAPRS